MSPSLSARTPSSAFALFVFVLGCGAAGPAPGAAAQPGPPAPARTAPAVPAAPEDGLTPYRVEQLTGPPDGPVVRRAPTPAELHDYRQRQYPGAVWPPPGYTAEPPPCELETVTTVKQRGKTFEVRAVVRNLTQKTLVLALEDRCPEGPAIFHGLGAGFDYYGACALGACVKKGVLSLSLAPDESREIAAITIDPERASCGKLAPGTYTLSFGVKSELRQCSPPAPTIEHRATAPRPATAPSRQKVCPPSPACGIACPGGRFAVDQDGCTLCGCAEDPLTR